MEVYKSNLRRTDIFSKHPTYKHTEHGSNMISPPHPVIEYVEPNQHFFNEDFNLDFKVNTDPYING